ncbi:hypothetical protein ACF1BN_13285 [Streptomyces sp. NPDC014861]|uniref:hypothetical protein n=1 Tax=Streptomyces sp. NPDC014861 TaxID=3364923 RepID=UPI00370120D8
MKTVKRWAAACAVAPLLAATAACTSDDGARPAGAAKAAEACAYAWSNVVERDVLTGVAKRQTFGEDGGRLTQPLRRLHTPRTEAATETGPRTDPATALRSLGAHVGGGGEDSAFAEAGRPAPDLDTIRSAASGPGTLVSYAYVREVTADFRRTCTGGEPSTGSATSWSVDGGGVLRCEESRADLEGSGPALEAALRSCGPGAPATRG